MTALLLALALAGPADGGYLLPPPDVVKLVDARRPPAVQISPDARYLLLVDRPSLPPIEDVCRPWIGLAGLRIDLGRGAPFQTAYDSGLALLERATGVERRIELPAGARIGGVLWSHDSARFAFSIATDDGVELWIGEAATAAARRVATGLNGVLDQPYSWLSDGARLLVRLVPDGRGAAPEQPRAPAGPSIQETAGNTTPIRTIPDLLTGPHDELLLEHYGTSQLALLDAAGGALTKLGPPALYGEVVASPDGAHFLVERIHRPFSYVLALSAFPRTVELWDATGTVEKRVAELPMEENVPIEGVPTGPRNFRWQATAPATLWWCEALDGGDPNRAAEQRDRWVALAAPFQGEAVEMTRLAGRARGVSFLADSTLFLAGEFDRDRRWVRTTLLDAARPGAPGRVAEDRSQNDRYGDPGQPVMVRDARGQSVIARDGGAFYRAGEGSAGDGARPFLDRVALDSLASERLWRCEAGWYESFVAFVARGAERKPVAITRREAAEVPPNYFERDLEAESARAITAFPDPTPELRGIKKQLLTYRRADGVELSGTLYLPKDYAEGTRLPLVVWAYPLEFTDARTAGQVSGSPHRFTAVSGASHLLFLTQGYAVLDNATMPVVGDPKTCNDTFIDQIVSSAAAAIETVAGMGVADPARVGVGGHSYGAFMTANLLAHCDLFKAGIARSGAYNRTLTPFGFQSERRTFWEAREVYQNLSPFWFADRLKEPILLVHGALDNNQGTFPIQSERLYAALKGNGGTARMVMLPGESHGYAARESNLHVLAEMFAWFDRHVKGAVPAPAAGGAAAGAR